MFYIFNGIFIEALDRRGIKVFNSVTLDRLLVKFKFPAVCHKKITNIIEEKVHFFF
jgi:hypothetical protein